MRRGAQIHVRACDLPDLSRIRQPHAIEMSNDSPSRLSTRPKKTRDVTPGRQVSITGDHLTAILAERVMGWRVGPERFLMGDRRWLPRWRFQPAEHLEDAFRLFEQAGPQEYSMGAGENGTFWVKVRVAGATGEALEPSKPRAITFAIARAFGIDVDSTRLSTIDGAGVKRRGDDE